MLKTYLETLYRLEINVELVSFWDGGWVCKVDGSVGSHDGYKFNFGSHNLAAVETFLSEMVIRYERESKNQ